MEQGNGSESLQKGFPRGGFLLFSAEKNYEGAAFYCKADIQGFQIEVIDSVGQTIAQFRLETTGKIPVLIPGYEFIDAKYLL